MKNFIKYAQYYDLLYRDKNYKEEADYVARLIERYSHKNNKTLLDIGCGTGNHDIWFAKKGYRVVGIDRASEMDSIARNRIAAGGGLEFHLCDVSKFTLHRKFDVAVSLFHVMSYLTTNAVFIKSLQNIYKHLKRNSLFIFDFWYGPAVLTQRPSLKTKNISDGERSITRIAMPRININANTVDAHYKINIKNKKSNFRKEIVEDHILRYFFLPELYLMLELAGFKVIKCLKWMSFKEGLNENSWSGLMIARKNSVL